MPAVDFLLIGAMKAGTTTLVDYLRRHPQIYMPPVKEIQYFSRDHKYAKGQAWYESFFTDAKPGQVRGEGSTCYSRWPRYSHAAERVYDYCPDVKFIYIVREPVKRTYSHYRHSYLRNEINYTTFQEALVKDEELIASSKYMLQIEQYLKYFDIEQFHFIKFEDLVSTNPEIFDKLCDFLCIDKFDFIGNSRLASNPAGYGSTRARVVKLIRAMKYIPGVSSFVKRRYSAQQRKQIMRKIADRVTSTPVGKVLLKNKAKLVPELRLENRELIKSSCRDDLKKFEALSKLDLGQWY